MEPNLFVEISHQAFLISAWVVGVVVGWAALGWLFMILFMPIGNCLFKMYEPVSFRMMWKERAPISLMGPFVLAVFIVCAFTNYRDQRKRRR